MCNNSKANLEATPRVSLEIPTEVLDNVQAITGRNPLLWLQHVLDETDEARTSGNAKAPVASGFADLESREVEIARLVDRVVSSMADLVMFQAASPPSIPPVGDSIAEPKTDIVLPETELDNEN